MCIVWVTTACAATAAADATLSRSEVVAMYRTLYEPVESIADGWTGDVTNCAPGTLDPAHLNGLLDRHNFYRLLAGVPATTLHADPEAADTQQAALMLAANQALDRDPPPSWNCYTTGGDTALTQSILGFGLPAWGIIDFAMDNTVAGAPQRRVALWSRQEKTAFGYATSNAAYTAYRVLDAGAQPPVPNGIAWPPAGFVPWNVLPDQSNEWIFAYPGADFSSATVTMTFGDNAWPVTDVAALTPMTGDAAIGWKPTGFPYTRPDEDTAWHVTVSGVMNVPGAPATFEYDVVVIDPDRRDPVFGDGFEVRDVAYDIDFCRLHFPTFILWPSGGEIDIFGRVYIAGLTDRSGVNDPAPEVIGEMGYGPDGSDPANGWTWTQGMPNPDYGPSSSGYVASNDEYVAVLTVPAAGEYDFAYRFSGDGGKTFTYCDLRAGSSDGYSPEDAGSLTSF